ncbi:MAG: cyclopropane fatty acyl phospholipid synthase [Patescibacteria group bacterium]
MSSSAETFVRKVLKRADVEVGGNRPWDIQIHNPKFYGRVLSYGSLGFGESYVDGWWECNDIPELINRILRNRLHEQIPFDLGLMWSYVRGKVLNNQKWKAFEVGEKHYDIGNDLYRSMLDKRLAYSCAYWNPSTSSGQAPQDLDEAQEAKLDLICRKIGLQSGGRILDIGSGWGSFLGFAAEKYGAEGVGVTVSKEQARYANETYAKYPVETKVQDYRSVDDTFDHVVSVGMFEHVGYKNYREYMRKVHSVLRSDGYFLLHTIGGNASTSHGEPWLEKYIFPNGMLPSIQQIGAAAEGLFVMEDWHNLGTDYEKTVLEWFKRFDANWTTLKNTYDERFYRMWKYYLHSCAGAFRSRHMQLWQIVFSKDFNKKHYISVR